MNTKAWYYHGHITKKNEAENYEEHRYCFFNSVCVRARVCALENPSGSISRSWCCVFNLKRMDKRTFYFKVAFGNSENKKNCDNSESRLHVQCECIYCVDRESV